MFTIIGLAFTTPFILLECVYASATYCGKPGVMKRIRFVTRFDPDPVVYFGLA